MAPAQDGQAARVHPVAVAVQTNCGCGMGQENSNLQLHSVTKLVLIHDFRELGFMAVGCTWQKRPDIRMVVTCTAPITQTLQHGKYCSSEQLLEHQKCTPAPALLEI